MIGLFSPRRPARLLPFAAALFCAAVTAPQASAGPVSAVDVRGIQVSLPAPPRRIVSLIPANTEILFALGVGDRVVGVTEYCDYPARAHSIARVGDMNTSIEKVLALRPDLVLASASGNRSALERLERLGPRRPPVFAVDPQTVDQLLRDIGTIGRLTGAEKAAAAVTRRMVGALTAARAVAKRGGKPVRALFVVQQSPLWVAASGNFMHDLMRLAGLVNVAEGLGKGFSSLPLERAIALRPEVVVTSQIPLADLKARPGWSSMAAVRAGRVVTMGFDAVRPGPRVVDAVLDLARRSRPGG